MIRKLTLLTLVAAAGFAVACSGTMAKEAAESAGQDDAVMVPMFEVDPLWPKNLPNHWLMGPTIGVDVDSRDNIWVVHRNTPDNFQGGTEIGLTFDPPISECCQPGPPVLVFDQGGQPARQLGRPRHGEPETTSGRSRTTASPSTTWTTSGSAATAAATPTC